MMTSNSSQASRRNVHAHDGLRKERLHSTKGAHTPPSHSPFTPPNHSGSPSPSADSGNTSGHDEFHLERYSQATPVEGQNGKAQAIRRNRLPSESPLLNPKETNRPGLNIITTFNSTQCSLTDNFSIEQVYSRRPQLARRAATSIVSAKAEAANITPPLRRSQSRGDPSIVIGISVPEDEAESFKNFDTLDSTLTLETPATPKHVDARGLHAPVSHRRPTSSVYSVPQASYAHQSTISKIPPVPRMSSSYAITSNPFSNKHEIEKDELISNEDQEDNTTDAPTKRNSTESQEPIIASAIDTARPKSQGWWNLALSPMLSRGDTLQSKQKRKSSRVVAQLFAKSALKKRTDPSPEEPKDEISPETPRRAGLATELTEPWSGWPMWVTGAARGGLAEGILKRSDEREEDGHNHKTELTPCATSMTAPARRIGTSADYYHACALEQATGVPYFECINHSCSEQLPILRSLRDSHNPVTALGFQDGNSAADPEPQRQPIPTPLGKEKSLDSNDSASIIDSESDEISPQIISPNVRKARTAAVVRARTLTTDGPKSIPETLDEYFPPQDQMAESAGKAPLPAYSPPRPLVMKLPNIAAIVVPSLKSPGPVSPEMQRSMTAQGAMPMSQIRAQPDSKEHTFGEPPMAQPQTAQINLYNYYAQPPMVKPPASVAVAPVTLANIEGDHEKRPDVEDRGRRHEKKGGIIRRLRSLWHGAGSGCVGGTGGSEKIEKRRWLFSIAALFLLIIVVSIILATELTRHGDDTPVQSQWLNLTGFPPMPTGISTIVRPDLTFVQSGCVQTDTLWSCALPKEDQANVAPNDPDQPNFRFEIRFKNGTVPANETIPLSPVPKQSVADDPFTNDLYTPAPNPPSVADQTFLGNTTDYVTSSYFAGEQTPFFITFISPSPIIPGSSNNSKALLPRHHGLVQRQSNSSLLSSIPPPSTTSSGLAAPANLLPNSPYPSSQPIHLYNRGLADEHYGFYIYYDRSIFLQDTSVLNTTSPSSSPDGITADQNGGSPLSSAAAMCTFSQTRFLVRVYTSPSFSGTLFPATYNTTTSPPTITDGLVSNSATDYTPPGSFPYPTTITLDRHGGDLNAKAVYCYGMDGQGHILANEKSLVAEDRSFGGPGLVNPAPPLVSLSGAGGSDGFNASLGGIDGGTGGCGCTWQNWS